MRQNHTAFLPWGTAAALAVGLLGCQSTPVDRSSAVATNMSDSADLVSQVYTGLEQTLAALNNLVNNPDGNLRPQYQAFSAQLESLEADAAEVTEAAVAMREKGQEYFITWDAEMATIRNEDIRARSESRRAEVEQQFDEVREAYEMTRQRLDPVLRNLRDIRTYLSTDLTAAGLEAIRNQVREVTGTAGPLRESLGRLTEEFRSLGVAMAPAATGQP